MIVWISILSWTKGTIPYPEFSNTEVIQKVEEGYRLPKPKGCSDELYQLMLKCWALDPKERCEFSAIVSKLKSILQEESQSMISTESSIVRAETSYTSVDMYQKTPVI